MKPSTAPVDLDRSNTLALLRWASMVAVVVVGVGVALALVARSIDFSSPLPVPEPAAPAAGGGDPADAGPFSGVPGVGSPGEPVDRPLADFRLATLDGKPIGPPDFAGSPVVLDFWATWCGPCRFQAQILDKLHDELAPKGVKFLGIDVGEPPEIVRPYVAKAGFPYPTLLDVDSRVASRYGVSGFPTVMVVDREGRIAFVRVGVTDGPTLKKVIAGLG